MEEDPVGYQILLWGSAHAVLHERDEAQEPMSDLEVEEMFRRIGLPMEHGKAVCKLEKEEDK